MLERRKPVRHAVDAHLDDLQSEMEAEARFIQKLQADAGRVQSFFRDSREPVDLMGALFRRVAELRESVSTQRTTLKLLRVELQALRQRQRATSPKR